MPRWPPEGRAQKAAVEGRPNTATEWGVGVDTTVQSELGRLTLDLFQKHTFQGKEMGAGPEQPMISKYSQQRLWDSAGDAQGVRPRGSRRLSPALAW